MKYGNTTLTALIGQIKAEYPPVYNTFFSRIYDQDSTYCDWRIPLAEYAFNAAGFLLSSAPGELPETSRCIAQAAFVAGRHDAPLFFVRPEILAACDATEVLAGQSIRDLPLPYESFAFVLPPGAVRYLGEDVPYIHVFRELKGHYTFPHPLHDVTVEVGDDGLAISTTVAGRQEQLLIHLNDESFQDIDEYIVAEAFKDTLTRFDDQGRWIVSDRSKEPLGEKDNSAETAKRLVRLVRNLVNAMAAVPDVLTRERRVKQLRRDRTRELWTPNYVGRTFRVQLGGGDPGSHASPRTHWRRGHFRRQGYGRNVAQCKCGHAPRAHAQDDLTLCMEPGCSCQAYDRLGFSTYRTVWIQPVLVNA